MAKTSIVPQMSPITTAPTGETRSHPAVIPTSPAKIPLSVSDSEGLPYLSHVTIMVATPPAAAARFVVRNTWEMAVLFISPLAANWLPGLNPNHPSHNMNTPSAANVRLCPGMARLLPSLLYFPRRGPSAMAPINANTPPTLCTMAEPAKSWNTSPKVDIMNPSAASLHSQPPPHVQCPSTG